MIVSNQEIHNVLDLANTGFDPARLIVTVSAGREVLQMDAAPRVRVDQAYTERPAVGSRSWGDTHRASTTAIAPQPPAYRPQHPSPLPTLPGQDRRWRHTRVHDLQRQLADGRYAVVPDIVADKIIGRALCDQVSRLYDR